MLGVLDLDPTNGYYNVVKADGQEGWVWGKNVEIDPDEAFEVLTAAIPAYDRDDWKHWIDADGDCQNTRNEVLIRDSTAPVTFKPRADGKQCTVSSGRWVDPYSTEIFTDPKDLDIDHVVALQNAHLSGGWSWDAEKRKDYANSLADSAHLLAVKASPEPPEGRQGPRGVEATQSGVLVRVRQGMGTYQGNLATDNDDSRGGRRSRTEEPLRTLSPRASEVACYGWIRNSTRYRARVR
ncbi:MAG: HNH endonuclease family protein [Acidobacteria bacterium]|nr:HNH endonuclease family protein [Acidobacteriota bacterium]